MSTLELMGRSPERQKHIATLLTNRTLWVCFLNPEGYETYIQVHCHGDGTMTAEEPVPHFTARSLAKRIGRQPYCNSPEYAIYPLLQLPEEIPS